eukprot:m.26398 g.26398  ORF g.26398 m.26398 type:complete len:137 (+) comp15392_c0_seq1:576-986(+)
MVLPMTLPMAMLTPTMSNSSNGINNGNINNNITVIINGTINGNITVTISTTSKPEHLKSSHTGDTPRVGFLVSVVQWFDTLHSFLFTHSRWISHLEKAWCELDKPLGFNRGNLAHVFSCRKCDFVVNDPLWLSIKQ